MLGCCVCACMDEDTLLYEVCVYQGHVFRRYPDGCLTSANDADWEIASKW